MLKILSSDGEIPSHDKHSLLRTLTHLKQATTDYDSQYRCIIAARAPAQGPSSSDTRPCHEREHLRIFPTSTNLVSSPCIAPFQLNNKRSSGVICVAVTTLKYIKTHRTNMVLIPSKCFYKNTRK